MPPLLNIPNLRQIDLLTRDLETNRPVALGFGVRDKEGLVISKQFWEKCAKTLNAVPNGAQKSALQWRQYYYSTFKPKIKNRLINYYNTHKSLKGLIIPPMHRRLINLLGVKHFLEKKKRSTRSSVDDNLANDNDPVEDQSVGDHSYCGDHLEELPENEIIDDTIVQNDINLSKTEENIDSETTNTRPSRSQIELLIQFLEINRHIAIGTAFKSGGSSNLIQLAWNECAKILNAVPGGAVKSSYHWIRYYHSYKKKIKDKIRKHKNDYDFDYESILTTCQCRLVKLIGLAYFTGKPSAIEKDPIGDDNNSCHDIMKNVNVDDIFADIMANGDTNRTDIIEDDDTNETFVEEYTIGDNGTLEYVDVSETHEIEESPERDNVPKKIDAVERESHSRRDDVSKQVDVVEEPTSVKEKDVKRRRRIRRRRPSSPTESSHLNSVVQTLTNIDHTHIEATNHLSEGINKNAEAVNRNADALEVFVAQMKDFMEFYMARADDHKWGICKTNPKSSEDPLASTSEGSKRLQHEQKLPEQMIQLFQSIKSNNKKDSFDIYGQYVASELREVNNEHSVLKAKYEINKILLEMKMNSCKVRSISPSYEDLWSNIKKAKPSDKKGQH